MTIETETRTETGLETIKKLLEESSSYQNSEPLKATELAEQALGRLALTESRDCAEVKLLQARALLLFGMGNARQGKFREAMPFIEESLQIALGTGDTTAITNGLISTAYIYRFLSEFELSKKYYEDAAALARESGDAQLEARAVTGLGVLCFSQGDYFCALTKFSDALFLQEKIGDELGMAYTLQNIGGIYSTLFDFGSAQEYHYQALEKWRKLGNKSGEAMTLNNIGLIFRDLYNFDKAKEIFEQCIAIQDEAGDLNSKALAMMNLATVFAHQEKYDAAVRWYHESLKIHHDSGNRFAEGSVLINLGEAYFHKENYTAAYKYLSEAMEIIFSLKARRNYSVLFHKFAELATKHPELFEDFDWRKIGADKKKNSHPAEYFLRASETVAAETGSKSDLCNTAKLFFLLYKKMGKFELALKHHEEYFKYEREIFNEESDRRTKLMMVRFETERALKEAEILRLQNEKLGQEMMHRKQELDSMTLYLVQKNQALSSVRKLAGDAIRAKGDTKKKFLQQILRLTNNGSESFWQNFDERFRMVHGDFSDRLVKKFPELTPMEMRICTLVKAGLSSKEVAEILAISERTAENHRTNVRKKLNLDRTANLTTFLASF